MKQVYLKTEKSHWDKITKYLLRNKQEQAVFLLIDPFYDSDKIFFEIKDTYLVPREELDGSPYTIRLKDSARAKIIKWAWDNGFSLAEIHSHPFSKHDTTFSYSDIAGLEEFVPHLWWRLKGKPYLAIVLGKNDYDALVWLDDPNAPQNLGGILINNNLIGPTNLIFKSE